jgi:DeoR family glycerol-3-phosphate regulon repressor
MVPDGAAVILGGGATLEAVAEGLAARRGLTVVTNSVPNCLKLIGRNGHRIHLLGGAFQATNQTTLGGDAAEMLSKYYANFAIIGAGAISRQGEIMDYTLEEAELYRKMLRSAETAIVAADHSCFGNIALVRVDSLEEATCIVTDAEPEPAFTDVLDRLPVRLLVAGKST